MTNIDDDDDDDLYDYFESSLETLFGQRQPATGKPGQLGRLVLERKGHNDTTIIEYRIPTNKDSSNTRLFAHYQWDAGVHLAKMIHNGSIGGSSHSNKSKIIVEGKSVMELGAGTGLPSLVSALGGASKVVMTDYPDEGILTAMRENIQLCKVNKDLVFARGLDWSDSKQVEYEVQASPNSYGYDLILCADVLWLSSSHAPLLETLQSLLSKTKSSRALFLSGFHTGRRALASFFAKATEVGLCCDWELDNGGVFEYNVITEESRTWSGKFPFPSGQKISNINDPDTNGNEEDNMDDYTERTKWLMFVSLRWSEFREQNKSK